MVRIDLFRALYRYVAIVTCAAALPVRLPPPPPLLPNNYYPLYDPTWECMIYCDNRYGTPPTAILPNCICPFQESGTKDIFDAPPIISSFQPYQYYPAPIEYGQESVQPEYATPLTTELNKLQFNTKYTYDHLLCQTLNMPFSYPTIPDYSYRPPYEGYSERQSFMPEHILNKDFILDIGIQQKQTIKDEDIKDIPQSFSKSGDEESVDCSKIQQQINEAAKKDIKVSIHLSNDIMNKCLKKIMPASLEGATEVNNLVKDTDPRVDEDDLHSNTGVLHKETTAANTQVQNLVEDANSSVEGQAITDNAGVSKEKTDPVNNRGMDLVDDSRAEDIKTENTSISQEEFDDLNNGGANLVDDSRSESITENIVVSQEGTNAEHNGEVNLLEGNTMAQRIIIENNGISQQETNALNNGGVHFIDSMVQPTITENTGISQEETDAVNKGEISLLEDSFRPEGTVTENIVVRQKENDDKNNAGVNLVDDSMAQRIITENSSISKEETNAMNNEGVHLVDDSTAQNTITENTGTSKEETDAVNKGRISLLESNLKAEGTVTENIVVPQEQNDSGNNEGVNLVEDDSMAQRIITENSSISQEETNAMNNGGVHLVDDPMAQHIKTENIGISLKETDAVNKEEISLLEDNLRSEDTVTKNNGISQEETKGEISLLDDNLRAEGTITENIAVPQEETDDGNNERVNLEEDDSMVQRIITENSSTSQEETNAMNYGGVHIVDDPMAQHIETENIGISLEETDVVNKEEISLLEDNLRSEDTVTKNNGISQEETKGGISLLDDNLRAEGTVTENIVVPQEETDDGNNERVNLEEDDSMAQRIITENRRTSQEETNAMNYGGVHIVDDPMAQHIETENIGISLEETDAVNKEGISLLEDNLRAESTITDNIENNGGVNLVEKDLIAQRIIIENNGISQEESNAMKNGGVHLVDDSMAQHTIIDNTGISQEETDAMNKGDISLVDDDSRAEDINSEDIDVSQETDDVNNRRINPVEDDSKTEGTFTENTDFSKEKNDAENNGGLDLLDDIRAEDIKTKENGVSQEESNAVNNGGINLAEKVDSRVKDDINFADTGILKEEGPFILSKENNYGMDSILSRSMTFIESEENKTDESLIQEFEERDEMPSEFKEKDNTEITKNIESDMPLQLLMKENNYGLHSNHLRSDKEQISTTNVPTTNEQTKHSKPKIINIELLPNLTNTTNNEEDLDPSINFRTLDVPTLPDGNFTKEIVDGEDKEYKEITFKMLDKLHDLYNISSKENVNNNIEENKGLDESAAKPTLKFEKLDDNAFSASDITTETRSELTEHEEHNKESKEIPLEIQHFPHEKISGSNMNDNKDFMDFAMRRFTTEISSELTEHEDRNPESSLPASNLKKEIQAKFIKQEESDKDNTPILYTNAPHISDQLKESSLEKQDVTRVIELTERHEDMSIRLLQEKYGANNPFHLNADEMKAVPPILPGTKQGFVNMKTENLTVPIRITNNDGYVNIGFRTKDICRRKDGTPVMRDSVLIRTFCTIIGMIV